MPKSLRKDSSSHSFINLTLNLFFCVKFRFKFNAYLNRFYFFFKADFLIPLLMGFGRSRFNELICHQRHTEQTARFCLKFVGSRLHNISHINLVKRTLFKTIN